MNAPEELPPADQRWLDELFGGFVQTLTEGRNVDLTHVLGERIDLLPRAQELLELARQVTVRRPVEAPHFAGYELVSEIGRGGMGRVYCVRHLELGRIEALKTLPAQWLIGDRARTRFEREARAVARLQHPSIIPIYDVGECGGVPYFTMEFVKGRTLAGVLDGLRGLGKETKQLTAESVGTETAQPKSSSYVKLAARIIRDVARALAHAHEEGVIHRDVKPSNILLRPDGLPMLFDFGLASMETGDALTLTGEFLGTPHYVSPEQAAGQHVTASTDIFSLGTTLYEMLTLERPFIGATTQDILRAVQQREPRMPSQLNGDVPRDLETICLTALAKEPQRRYPSAAAFADDLDRFLDGHPVLARSVGTIERTWRLMRRHPAVTSTVLLSTLLLIGTPSALFWQARGANIEIQAALDEAEASRTIALEEKQNAENERDLAQEITDVFENMFDSIKLENGGRDARIFEVLDALATDIESLRPEVRAPLEATLGRSYLELSMYAEAELHLNSALSLYASMPRPPLAEDLAVRTSIVTLQNHLGQFDKAIQGGSDLLRAFEQAGLFNEDYVRTLASQSDTLLGLSRAPEALDLLIAGLAHQRLVAPQEPPSPTLQHNLGRAYAELGRFADSIAQLELARTRLIEMRGPNHPDPIATLILLAQVTKESGDIAKAGALTQSAMQSCIAHFGEEDLITITVAHNLAGIRDAEGDVDEAVRQEQYAAELAERALPELHPLKGYIYEVLATLLSKLERHDEAVTAQERSLSVRQGIYGEAHPLTIQAHFFLSRRAFHAKDFERAESELLLARDALHEVPEASDALVRATLSDLAFLYRTTGDQAKLAAAEAAFDEWTAAEDKAE